MRICHPHVTPWVLEQLGCTLDQTISFIYTNSNSIFSSRGQDIKPQKSQYPQNPRMYFNHPRSHTKIASFPTAQHDTDLISAQLYWEEHQQRAGLAISHRISHCNHLLAEHLRWSILLYPSWVFRISPSPGRRSWNRNIHYQLDPLVAVYISSPALHYFVQYSLVFDFLLPFSSLHVVCYLVPDTRVFLSKCSLL